MQTLANEEPVRANPTADEIRGILLRAAMQAGDGHVHVRGVDLVAAITGTIPEDWEPAT